MKIELDHVFVCASAGAPEAEELIHFGLYEGLPNVHPGQVILAISVRKALQVRRSCKGLSGSVRIFPIDFLCRLCDWPLGHSQATPAFMSDPGCIGIIAETSTPSKLARRADEKLFSSYIPAPLPSFGLVLLLS